MLASGIAAGTTAGINPYNIAASNAGAIAQVLNNELFGIGKDTMHNAKVVTRNLGASKIRGVDFALDYRHDVSFGSVYATFNRTYLDSSTFSPGGTVYGFNQAGLQNNRRLNSVTTVGASVGPNFNGQITWNHASGVRLVTPAALGQTTVAPSDTFDLYAQYDLKSRFSVPVTLTFGMTNMFDTDPPRYNGVDVSFGPGYSNGQTLGHVVQLGATVRF